MEEYNLIWHKYINHKGNVIPVLKEASSKFVSLEEYQKLEIDIKELKQEIYKLKIYKEARELDIRRYLVESEKLRKQYLYVMPEKPPQENVITELKLWEDGEFKQSLADGLVEAIIEGINKRKIVEGE